MVIGWVITNHIPQIPHWGVYDLGINPADPESAAAIGSEHSAGFCPFWGWFSQSGLQGTLATGGPGQVRAHSQASRVARILGRRVRRGRPNKAPSPTFLGRAGTLNCTRPAAEQPAANPGLSRVGGLFLGLRRCFSKL